MPEYYSQIGDAIGSAMAHNARLAAEWPPPVRVPAAREERKMPPEEAPTASDTYQPALPWAAQLDADDLEGFLADLAEAASGNDDLATLAEVEKTIATWRAIGDVNEGLRNAPGPSDEYRGAPPAN